MQNAAGAGLAAALNVPAQASINRGLVGNIKPRAADSSLVDMIKLLPDGIGVVPVYIPVTADLRDSGAIYSQYEDRIAYLKSEKCNLIAIEGAPPFMLIGQTRAAEMVDGWKRKFGIDIFTAPENQVNAFRALKAKKILGVTAGANGADVTKVYAKYFEDNGFSVIAMERLDFNAERDVPPATTAPLIKEALSRHNGVDAVYLLGPALEAMSLIDPIERDFGVPVVQAIVARVWEIQKRLKIREPIKGYGRLLESLPA